MSFRGVLQGPRGLTKVAVFCSGEGTNLEALIEAALPIGLVFSDRSDAPALARARQAKIPIVVGSEEDAAHAVEHYRCSLIVLAGYMKILSPSFVDRFRNCIINIHPSLLPAFPGAHAVRAALASGVRQTGCTVHYVTEKVDEGKIIAQAVVEILPDDSLETLTKRIHQAEHRLLPEVVAELIR